MKEVHCLISIRFHGWTLSTNPALTCVGLPQEALSTAIPPPGTTKFSCADQARILAFLGPVVHGRCDADEVPKLHWQEIAN
jgi:hypothetical protein